MKRIDINTQEPNFIGCWDLENKTLCDEIVTFFQNSIKTTSYIKNIVLFLVYKLKSSHFRIESRIT